MEIKTLTRKNGQELQFPTLNEEDQSELPLRIVDIIMDMEDAPEDVALSYKLVRELTKFYLSKAEANKWLDIPMSEFADLVSNEDEELKK